MQTEASRRVWGVTPDLVRFWRYMCAASETCPKDKGGSPPPPPLTPGLETKAGVVRSWLGKLVLSAGAQTSKDKRERDQEAFIY